MAHFEKLERALRAWVHEALASIDRESSRSSSLGMNRWQRDADGAIRFGPQHESTWDYEHTARLRELPSWKAVEQAFREEGRVRDHLDQLVGTRQGLMRFDAGLMSRIVLPNPDEIEAADEAFDRVYRKLDGFLATQTIEHVSI